MVDSLSSIETFLDPNLLNLEQLLNIGEPDHRKRYDRNISWSISSCDCEWNHSDVPDQKIEHKRTIGNEIPRQITQPNRKNHESKRRSQKGDTGWEI